MPLQNRVDPFGELFATPTRGLLMGNRGGRIHTDAQTTSPFAPPLFIASAAGSRRRNEPADDGPRIADDVDSPVKRPVQFGAARRAVSGA
jgi:hypothetical protein